MDPLNGRVDTLGSTQYLEIANYSCNVGYELIGDVLRQCQGDGEWSGEEPTCQSKEDDTDKVSIIAENSLFFHSTPSQLWTAEDYLLLKAEMWYTVQEPHTCLLLRLSATLAINYKDHHSECAKKTPIGQEILQCVRVGLVH